MRPLPAVLVATLLGACSGEPAVRVDNGTAAGGGDDVVAGGGDAPDSGAGEGGTPDAPDREPGVPGEDVAALPPGSRAGAYAGRIDGGSGVFVLDRDERLIGLATRPDGSGMSWFADFGAGTASGPALRFEHAAADAASGGAEAGAADTSSPLGTSAGEGPELGLVDGERIAVVSGDTVVELDAAGRGGLAPVTRASLAGAWRGEHRDCDSLGEHCSRFVMTLDIADNVLAGSSGVLTADGTDLFVVPMSGTLVPLGDFAEVVFEWNTYDYAGVVHFVPGESDRIVLIGYTDRELADYPVVAAVLTRTPDV